MKRLLFAVLAALALTVPAGPAVSTPGPVTPNAAAPQGWTRGYCDVNSGWHFRVCTQVYVTGASKVTWVNVCVDATSSQSYIKGVYGGLITAQGVANSGAHYLDNQGMGCHTTSTGDYPLTVTLRGSYHASGTADLRGGPLGTPDKAWDVTGYYDGR